jgi:hypothetical protein
VASSRCDAVACDVVADLVDVMELVHRRLKFCVASNQVNYLLDSALSDQDYGQSLVLRSHGVSERNQDTDQEERREQVMAAYQAYETAYDAGEPGSLSAHDLGAAAAMKVSHTSCVGAFANML